MDKIGKQLFHFLSTVQICEVSVMNEAYGQIIQGDVHGDVSDTVENINAIIKKYDYEIVRGKSDVSGVEYVTLVTISKNAISEHAKFFDKKTLPLFFKILQSCVLSDGAISETVCVNLSSVVEMSKTAAQAAINDLISKWWLETVDGMIYLGVRSISELGQLLISTFPEQVKQCPLCANIVCFGKTCLSCSVKGHVHCLNKFWEKTRGCPSCKKDWPITGNSDSETSPVSCSDESNNGPPRRKRSRVVTDDHED